MIRRLRRAATTLLQGTYGVTVEILALVAFFAFAALIAFIVSSIT